MFGQILVWNGSRSEVLLFFLESTGIYVRINSDSVMSMMPNICGILPLLPFRLVR